jgi:UDP-glucose 4-epimerase
MTTILTTGGAGYIGSNTVAKLLKSGFKVVVADDLSTGFNELVHPDAKFYNVNISNTEELTEIMRFEKISGVIHFAAKIIVPESISEPLKYYSNNTDGVISTLSACKKANVKKIVFSSTAAVYGNATSELITESTPASPINPYGYSKLFSEQIIKDVENEFGLKSVIFRYFNVAGASRDLRFGQRTKTATHLVKIASEAALKKREQMFITGTDYSTPDGTGVRDYIHVEDLAKAHVLAIQYLLDNGVSNLFNCGYGHGYSVKEVVNCMKKISGHDFNSPNAPRRMGDAASLVADPKKLKSTLGWKPELDDLEIICRTALEFERQLS